MIDEPPLVVVVQGSKESGKSTLIRSIIRHYTKHTISNIKGPITVRTSINKRVTFIECPNNLSSMVDLSKIADIALIVIDTSVGFEMETFEFLTMLQTHGMPHIMGILTHLDYYKENKQLHKTKKKMKKRFLQEVANEAKIFHLSGLHNGFYNTRDIINISRFIVITKVTPLSWRCAHSYLLADKYEFEGDKSTIYAYVRGTHLNTNKKIHVNGLVNATEYSALEADDPCPLEHNRKGQTKRTLRENEKILYAPQSSLTFANFERTTGYITIPDKYVFFTKTKENQGVENASEGLKMVRQLQEMQTTIDQKNSTQEHLIDGVKINKPVENTSNIEKLDDDKHEEIKPMVTSMYDEIYNENETSDELEDQIKLSYLDLNTITDEQKTIILSRFTNKEEDDENDKLPSDDDQMSEESMQEQEHEEEQEEPEKHSKKKGEENEEEETKKTMKIPLEKKQYKKGINRAEVVEQETIAPYMIRKGAYVKLQVNLSEDIISMAKTTSYPLILTIIDDTELQIGYMRVRIKKHRWYPKILKTLDPIIISMGWRRYQTIAVYNVKDSNDRLRMIKYTPKFGFCEAIIYGPIMPHKTSFLGIENIKENSEHFRIATLGSVLEVNKEFDLYKKLKLIGEPFKILKNTAFIKGMLNTKEEISKFIGASVKTVSGIRGQVKKACNEGPDGAIRCTFEDKIVMSDIVFCRTWHKVKLPRFYNPVIAYGKQRLLKSHRELRAEKGLPIPTNGDSEYKEIVREKRVKLPLNVSKTLKSKLPFKSMEKVEKNTADVISNKQVQKTVEKLGLNSKNMKTLMNDEEKAVASMMIRLQTIQKDKKKQDTIKKAIHKDKVQKEEAKKEKEQKLKKKLHPHKKNKRY